MLTREIFCRLLTTTGMKPIKTATRAAISNRTEPSAIRSIRGPLLGRKSRLTLPRLTLPRLTPGRLHQTRRTRTKAKQRSRRSGATSIHAVATIRASLADRLSRVARVTDPAMSHCKISLVVSLQLVQMRQTRRLQGRVIAVNGISGVERRRNLRLFLASLLELGRAIHSILQRTRPLRTPLMQLTLPLDRPR